jgi:hypothetical protein
MMSTILSIAVVVATALGAEWLVDSWLGEAWRIWIGLGGIALLLLAGALVKASGIDALTRFLRNAVIGAGIGAVLNRLGLRLAWLRRALGLVGIETEPAAGSQDSWRAPRMAGGLLWAGWAASLIGSGMTWTGLFGG